MKQIVTQFSGEENNWKKICEREIEARNAVLKKRVIIRNWPLI